MDVFTVSQLTRRIRNLLEFEIGGVWVEGEISNHRLQSSGHQYFTLKDAQAQITCVYFKGQARFSRVALQDGAKVRVFGELSVYEARGQYQLVVRQVTPVGAGRLFEAFEALKEKLRAEGLFEPERKRPLPSFPSRLAIVTSPTGAVLQDLLSILQRRAPWVEIVVYPVRVQGDGAYLEVIEALRFLADPSKSRPLPDAIVLARGGGSLEDLWNFNEEALAREIARCPCPVVSAIGHETDFSIADFVADLRAPTPSAAAELITPDGGQLADTLSALRGQLRQASARRLQRLDEQLGWQARGLAGTAPARRMERLAQDLDSAEERLREVVASQCQARRQWLEQAAEALRRGNPALATTRHEDRLRLLGLALQAHSRRRLELLRERLAATERQLRSLGPEATLARGYGIVFDEADRPISSATGIGSGQPLRIRLRDGDVPAVAR